MPSVKIAPAKKRKIGIIMMVLIVVGSTFLSFGIRTQDLNYAVELDEFDPYFNYRATKYLHDNGYEAYLGWHDDMSWYPQGRDVSATSQNALHIIAAYTYIPFESFIDLYTYTVYFPAIVGSLTTIVMFLLVRVMAGNVAATIAAGFFAMAVPFIQRGTGGWFKSEPLGLFLGFLALYLFISMIKNTQTKNNFPLPRAMGAGFIMATGVSAWGGVVFFMIPIGLWLMVAPLKIKFNTFAYVGLALFIVSMLGVSMLFDRAEILMFGIASMCVIIPFVFIIINNHIPIKNNRKKYLISLAIVVAVVGGALVSGIIDIPYGRYTGALLPFMSSGDVLTSSVSEHQIPTFGHLFERTVFMMIFAPIGIVALLKNKLPIEESMRYLILILGSVGIYVGLTYVRLELFMSLGMILFSSLGIVYILQRISIIKKPTIMYIIVGVLLVAMMMPAVVNWSIMMDRPPLIMFGASSQIRMTNDWIDALEWLKTSTPEDSKVMAWWDYGYWIETKGNRTTYMDNAAFYAWNITKYANILTDKPDVAVERLREIDVDYVLVYFLGSRLQVEGAERSLVVLGGGGDESKMPWILKIGGRTLSDYVDEHGRLNTKFYTNTLYGTMIPFVPFVDAVPGSDMIDPMSRPWETEINPETGEPYGYGVSTFNPDKLPKGLTLVYASPEFLNPPMDSKFNAVLIYKVE